jgi:hypothetical protein
MPLKGRNAVTIALERPGASADQGRFEDRIELQGCGRTLICRTLPRTFDGLATGATSRSAGLVKRMAWIDTNNDQFDLGGSAVGAGLNLTSALSLANTPPESLRSFSARESKTT